MKKCVLLPLAALLCLAVLAGCRTMVPGQINNFSGEDLSKAQKIVIYDAAGTEKAVLEEQADIDAFADAMNIDGWRFAEAPEDLPEAGAFTLWQTETVTALMGEREAKVNEICTFRIYEDGNCLTIETGLVDLHFSIPVETAEYLRGLTA